jgi:Na+-translocating ferredoxin:NAD+ oxidoreductase RnfD subunit
MLGFLAILLLLFWGIGLAAHLFGGLIHVALVVAVILGIAHMLRRTPTTSTR